MRFLIFSLLAFFLLTNTLISALDYQNVPMTANKIEQSVTEVAIVLYEAQNRLNGSAARINLWQPSIEKDVFGYSAAHIRIISKLNENFEAIEVGWHVYPWLYDKDERTKFFISHTVDSCRTTCYNEQNCDGFIRYAHGQTPGNIIDKTPGNTIDRVSVYGGEQLDMTVRIFQSAKKHWWLEIDGTKLGYWKSELFTHLRNGGTHAEWGGAVSYRRSQDTNMHLPIPMGSGHLPSEGYGKASYFEQLKIQISRKKTFWTSAHILKKEVTNSRCYDLEIHPNGIHDNDTAPGFYYGGPGCA